MRQMESVSARDLAATVETLEVSLAAALAQRDRYRCRESAVNIACQENETRAILAESRAVRAEEALRQIVALPNGANIGAAREIAMDALAAAGADTP